MRAGETAAGLNRTLQWQCAGVGHWRFIRQAVLQFIQHLFCGRPIGC